MTFKDHLLLARPMLNLFFGQKFLSTVEIGPNMAVLRGKGV